MKMRIYRACRRCGLLPAPNDESFLLTTRPKSRPAVPENLPSRDLHTHTPSFDTFNHGLFHWPSLYAKNITMGEPMNSDTGLAILTHGGFRDIIVVGTDSDHWCCVFSWKFMERFSGLSCFRQSVPSIVGVEVQMGSDTRVCHFLNRL